MDGMTKLPFTAGRHGPGDRLSAAGRLGTAARLSAADKINLAVEAPDTPMHVAAILTVDGASFCEADGSLRLDDVRAQILGRLARVPAMRRRLAGRGRSTARARWVDDLDFRIDRHVRAAAAAAPADEAALRSLAEDLLAPRLDRSHPLWRLWLVTGLTGGRIGVVIAIHHAMADGSGAIRLLSDLFGAEDGQTTAGAATAADHIRSSSRVDRRSVRAAAGRASIGWLHPTRAAASLLVAWHAIAHATDAPRTSLTGPIGPRRRLAVVRLDLATAIAIARATGATVNDAVLDVVAGGLRALLTSRSEPVEGVQLHVAVPVATAAPTPSVAGNNAGMMVVRLPLGDGDPRPRLAAIHAETAAAKRGQPATAGTRFLVWLARSGLMRQVTRHQHLTNTVVSNVIGPRSPITFLGTPIIDLIPVGPLAGNLASTFLAFSYAGALTVTVHVDADRFGDLDILTDAMSSEWRRLASDVTVD